MAPTHADMRPHKTSIVFSLPDDEESGQLFKALSVFALRDIDLATIQSRPLRASPLSMRLKSGARGFRYLFYVDMLINLSEERAQNALRHLQVCLWCACCAAGLAWSLALHPCTGVDPAAELLPCCPHSLECRSALQCCVGHECSSAASAQADGDPTLSLVQEFAPIMRVLGSFPREVVPDSLSAPSLDAAAALEQLALSSSQLGQAPDDDLAQGGIPEPPASPVAAEPGSNGASQPRQPDAAQQKVSSGCWCQLLLLLPTYV